jgi:hypothetical protein
MRSCLKKKEKGHSEFMRLAFLLAICSKTDLTVGSHGVTEPEVVALESPFSLAIFEPLTCS